MFDPIQLIKDYAKLEHHRTGTHEDAITCAWLAKQFKALGLATSPIDFPFTQYIAEWQCTVDARQVEAIPLFYSSQGRSVFDDIEVQPLELNDWQESETLMQIATLAEKQKRAGFSALVLATQSDNGSVYALNVSTESEIDFPVILTSAALVGFRASGFLQAQWRGSESRCLVAQNHPQPELILTTPFSGWFNCAAERAAGIAVLIELIQRLQSKFRIQVIATSGHELHHLGTEAVQRSVAIDAATPVLHIGSCVGVANSDLVLSSDLPLEKHLAAIEVWPELGARHQQLNPTNPNTWPGESRNWACAERSVISLVGVDRNFHTPRDTAQRINISPLSDIVILLQKLVEETLLTKT
ncbi:MAG: hypothetical protein AAF353_08980 [Pseudomonadota bacterium]